MTLKKLGVATVGLAGAAALCARHMKSQLHESGTKGCPCMPATATDARCSTYVTTRRPRLPETPTP